MPKFRHQLVKILGQEPSAFLASGTITEAVPMVEQSLKWIETSEQYQKARKKLSREIGIAKRAGNPAEPIIEKVAQVSAEIGILEAKLSEQLLQLKQLLTERAPNEQTPDVVEAPQHFQPDRLPETSSQPDDLSVRCELPFPVTDWQRYVEQHAKSTAYHDAGWHGIIDEIFGHTPHYLIARDNSGIVGVLPLIHMNSRLFGSAVISLPYVNYSGVLADSTAIAQALMDHAASMTRELGASHFELRDTSTRNAPATKQHKVSMILTLPASDDLLDDALGSKLRAQVKRAQQHGLTFKHGGLELVNCFYRVFSRNMRDLGTPVYSRTFFESILNAFPDKASVAVIYQGDKPVAAGFLIGHKDKMEIPWASSLRQSNHLGTNMLLYRSILGKTIEMGYPFFDFGRSSIGASTHKFKRQWGAKEFPLYWHYWLTDSDELPEVNPQNPKYQLAIKAWKRLPVAVANLIGPHLAKNLP